MRGIKTLSKGIAPLALLAACLSVPVAHAGWIEDRPGGTVIHVKLFDLPDPTSADPASRARLAAVEAFKEEFPRRFAVQYRARYEANPARYGQHDWTHVEVALERFTGITVKGVEVDLLAIAGGLAPDVLYVNFRKSETYIRNQFLYPLDNPGDGYLSAMSDAEKEFRVNPRLWPVIRRPGPGGVHVWALPFGGALGGVLMFRKDLFDAHRMAYPNADWTTEDLLEAARNLTDPATGTYGFFLARGVHEAHYWLPLLGSYGGEAVRQDPATGDWQCAFDSREAAEALDLYLRLSVEKWVDSKGVIQRGYSCKDAADATARLERGQVGMWFAYMDEKLMATINPDVTGIAPIPKGPRGDRGTELNSMMMGLFAGIREPAVRDAAWEYMRFFDSGEALAVKTRVLVESGLGRFIHPKYLRQLGYGELERLSPPGWARTFEIAMETGRPEPYAGNSNLAYEMMTRPLQRAESLALRDQLPPERGKRLDILQEMLHDGVRRANEQMMGIVAPRERTLRRVCAGFALAGIVLVFAAGFRYVARAFAPAGPVRLVGAGRRGLSPRSLWIGLLLLPALGTILVWQYLPMVQGSVMAFQDYHLVGDSRWVGLDNIGDVLFDGLWWKAVFNSFRYSALVLALTFLPPIGLAILLQEIPIGKLFFRLVYYLPAVVTGIVTILLWKEFLDPSSQGLLNQILMRVPAWVFLGSGAGLLALAWAFARRLWQHERGVAGWIVLGAGGVLMVLALEVCWPILVPGGEAAGTVLARLPLRLGGTMPEAFHWLADPATSMLSCVLPMVWAGMGPGSLIYLAALKGIPPDFYEAADVDGATFIDKILFVVVPMLKPLILINFTGAFIASFYSAAGNIMVMTGGSANTEVGGLHIWYKAFTYLQFGPATAAAWMLGVILVGFTIQQIRMLAGVEFRAGGQG